MNGPEKKNKAYLIIDLKSFYASVECVVRGLDPMSANLVVADPSRGRGTICLAVSPSMKALGVRNRCRVFEIPEGIDYIMAPPQMKLYLSYSARIYGIYLRFLAKEDIHVYSVDEAFLYVTPYLSLYHSTPRELGETIMKTILDETGITATCGIGPNLYLAKIALDIESKHLPDHIGELDQKSYRDLLWDHRPLTDFWMVGPGTARRLERMGIYTMREVAQADPDLVRRALGINGQYLIDHAWGREPVTMREIKAYEARDHSLSSGQILPRDYTWSDGLLILKEMTAELVLDLVRKHYLAGKVSLYVGYAGDLKAGTGGEEGLPHPTASSTALTSCLVSLYQRTVDPSYDVRKIAIVFGRLTDRRMRQLSLFDDRRELKEEEIQTGIQALRDRYGKNAVLRGMDLCEAGMTRERHGQIGGHKMINPKRKDLEP